MVIVIGVVIGYSGYLAVYVSPAQIFGSYHLVSGRLNEGRTRKEYRTLLLHYDTLVRHCWNISPARRAGTHHHGNLRYGKRGHVSLIVEYASEMITIREDVALML